MPQNQPDNSQPLDTSDLLAVLNHPSFLKLGISDQRTVLSGLTNRSEFDQMTDADTFKFMSAVRSAQPTQYEQQESQRANQLRSVPGMATDALPIIGGIAGGAAGLASPIPGGAMIGGGLGAAGGEQLREHLMQLGGGNATNPTSKQGLINTGMAGALGAGGEAPAAAMAAIGRRAEGKIAQSAIERATVEQSNAAAKVGAKQATDSAQQQSAWLKLASQPNPAWEKGGDIGAAIARVRPPGNTGAAMSRAFKTDNQVLSRALGQALGKADQQGPIALDNVLGSIKNEAAFMDQHVPGTAAYIDGVIDKAKGVAGISGSDATASQLATFRQYLGAYSSSKNDPQLAKIIEMFGEQDPVQMAQVTKGLRIKAYGVVNDALKTLLGPDANILENMQNNHAAIQALKNFNMPTKQVIQPILDQVPEAYKAGRLSTLGIKIANSPWGAAIGSPTAIAAGAAGSSTVRNKAKSLALNSTF